MKVMPAAYLFSDALDCAEPWRPDRVSLAFYRIKSRLGLDIRLHDLRPHARHPSCLPAAEITGPVDLRGVAGRLGHDPAVTMRIYGDLVPAADRKAADTMGRLLGPRHLSAASCSLTLIGLAIHRVKNGVGDGNLQDKLHQIEGAEEPPE